jgi:hypothetical protein
VERILPTDGVPGAGLKHGDRAAELLDLEAPVYVLGLLEQVFADNCVARGVAGYLARYRPLRRGRAEGVAPETPPPGAAPLGDRAGFGRKNSPSSPFQLWRACATVGSTDSLLPHPGIA